MKIFFAGTPEIAVPVLRTCAHHFNICGVLTNPDRPSGRKGKMQPPPVKTQALELDLKVYQPEKIDDDFINTVGKLSPDILLTFAYGNIFRKNFLDLFKGECLNIHPSLLPRHRGPSPLSAAILAGDTVTGITIQKMALKMDSGNIIEQFSFPLTGNETLKDLSGYTAVKSAEIIIDVLNRIINNSYNSHPQDDAKATYCTLVKKEDGLINWNMDAEMIERMYRAYYPWPGIFTHCSGKTIAFTECCAATEIDGTAPDRNILPGTVIGADKNRGLIVKTGKGYFCIKRLKPEARNDMDYKSFLNGNKNFIGCVLGS